MDGLSSYQFGGEGLILEKNKKYNEMPGMYNILYYLNVMTNEKLRMNTEFISIPDLEVLLLYFILLLEINSIKLSYSN